MIRREDTQRAVEILARYQRILRSPAEQPLQVSIGKVVHLFQSELFEALLDIQECYEFSLLSACKQDETAAPEEGSPPTSLGDVSTKGYLEKHEQDRKAQQGTLPGEAPGDPGSEPAPRLVRVTENRSGVPVLVSSLVVSVRSTLPKVSDLQGEEGRKEQTSTEEEEEMETGKKD